MRLVSAVQIALWSARGAIAVGHRRCAMAPAKRPRQAHRPDRSCLASLRSLRLAAFSILLVAIGVPAAPASELNLNGLWAMRAWKRVDPVKGILSAADRGFFVIALRHDRRTGEVRGMRVKLPPGSMPKGYQASPLVPLFAGRIDGDSIVRSTTAWALPGPHQKCPAPPAYGFRIGTGGRELELLLMSERDQDGFGCPIHTAPELVKERNLPNHSVYTYEPLYLIREVRFVAADTAPGTPPRALKTVSAGQPFRVEVLFDLAPAFPIYATLSGKSGPVDVVVKASDRADVFQSDIIRIKSQR